MAERHCEGGDEQKITMTDKGMREDSGARARDGSGAIEEARQNRDETPRARDGKGRTAFPEAVEMGLSRREQMQEEDLLGRVARRFEKERAEAKKLRKSERRFGVCCLARSMCGCAWFVAKMLFFFVLLSMFYHFGYENALATQHSET